MLSAKIATISLVLRLRLQGFDVSIFAYAFFTDVLLTFFCDFSHYFVIFIMLLELFFASKFFVNICKRSDLPRDFWCSCDKSVM